MSSHKLVPSTWISSRHTFLSDGSCKRTETRTGCLMPLLVCGDTRLLTLVSQQHLQCHCSAEVSSWGVSASPTTRQAHCSERLRTISPCKGHIETICSNPYVKKLNVIRDYPTRTCSINCSKRHVSICCLIILVLTIIFLLYGQYWTCRFNVGICFQFSQIKSKSIVYSKQHIEDINDLARNDNISFEIICKMKDLNESCFLEL